MLFIDEIIMKELDYKIVANVKVLAPNKRNKHEAKEEEQDVEEIEVDFYFISIIVRHRVQLMQAIYIHSSSLQVKYKTISRDYLMHDA